MLVDVQDRADVETTGKYMVDKVAATVVGLISDGGNPNSPFADIRVRRAVEHAIDKNAIVNQLFQGFETAATQAARPGQWWYNPAVKGYPYNPKKAKELLAQAGYPNGFPTKIIYIVSDEQQLMLAYQAYLKAVGIEAKLEPVSSVQYSQIRYTGWDGLLRWWMPAGSDIHPGQLLQVTLSGGAKVFISKVRFDDFDAKIEKALDELNDKKKKVLYQELTKIISDRAMACPVYVRNKSTYRTPQVHNEDAGIHQVWGVKWTPADAWLSK